MKNAWLRGVVCLSILTSCEHSTPQQMERYFPLQEGQTWEYAVEETRYSLTELPEARTWYLRERVGEEVGELNGAPVYKLERYTRSQEGDEWVIREVWSTYQQPDKWVKMEDNTPYIKLRYPLTDGMSWDGNALNTLGNHVYRLRFDGTQRVEVEHARDSSLVHLEKSIELYQSGIGMVYKEERNYAYCQSSPDCIGKGIVSSGFDRVYRLIR